MPIHPRLSSPVDFASRVEAGSYRCFDHFTVPSIKSFAIGLFYDDSLRQAKSVTCAEHRSDVVLV
eukprot:scaffold193231_cov39-Tisochrysis_lutea.AAC.2